MSKVSIIGLGYVGLPLALLASKKGHDVVGIDLNREKVAAINNREDPLQDEYIADRIKNTKLRAADNFDSVAASEIVIVCVPTPVKDDYQPDLGPVKGAVSSLAKKLRADTLVIIESTINPGVCDEIVIPLIEKESGLKINKDFYVSHCPERINPGDKKWNVENIPRVTGSSAPEGLNRTVEFYESIVDAPVKPMGSLKEAEAVKIVEFSFRDINIAFVNELAMSFAKLGIDVRNVIDGAATKPFAFMPHYPSVGVGGHCIPVDPYYLIEYAHNYGFDHKFLKLARQINNGMPGQLQKLMVEPVVVGDHKFLKLARQINNGMQHFAVEVLNECLKKAGSRSGARVAVLGLSYKPNVADDRESPSYELIELLKNAGADVETYDPYFPEKSSLRSFPSGKKFDAVIVATNHAEFTKLEPAEFQAKKFIDGKNAFARRSFEDNGIIYNGIGR